MISGRPSAKALRDRHDVVVDGLRKSDHGQSVIVCRKECCEVCSGGIRIVAADGVQDVDAVLHELLRCHSLRVLALVDEAALHAVLDVRELDA